MMMMTTIITAVEPVMVDLLTIIIQDVAQIVN